MKKFIFIGLMLSLGIALSQPVQSQTRVSFNINLQPYWGPVGYNYVEYYFFPEFGIYYHVPSQEFVFFANGRWRFAPEPPYWMGSFDPFTSYKVVVNQPRAYMYYRNHCNTYVSRGGYYPRQVVIRDGGRHGYNKGYRQGYRDGDRDDRWERKNRGGDGRHDRDRDRDGGGRGNDNGGGNGRRGPRY